MDTTPHIVYCRRSAAGKPMSVSYEDIRIAPDNDLANCLLSKSLEEELADTGPSDPLPRPTRHINTADLQSTPSSPPPNNAMSGRVNLRNPLVPANPVPDVSPPPAPTVQNNTVSKVSKASSLSLSLIHI